jgi:hypothetical protein
MMIILREKTYSNPFLSRITNELDRSKYEDYDVSSTIPEDSISLTTDLGHLKIYVPVLLEYSQYGIDDFIRSMSPFIRTSTVLDRNIFEMTLSGKLTEAQYIKLIKYIIDQEEFCTIIDEDK